MNDHSDFQSAPPFNNPKNIVVGKARIIYAPQCGHLDAGWVLPSGLRTQDRFKAHAYAVRMNELMGGPKQEPVPERAVFWSL